MKAYAPFNETYQIIKFIKTISLEIMFGTIQQQGRL